MPIRKLFPKPFGPADTLPVMGQTSQAALGPEIKMLTWNIQKGRNTLWLDDFLSIQSENDLILLQEAVLNTATDSIFKTSETWEWVMARSYQDRRTLFETGVKTGAVAPSSLQARIPSQHPEPLVRTRKMILATSYPLTEREDELLVLNIHGVNFVSLQKHALQLGQISHLIEGHVGPVIVAGDFNTWSGKRRNNMLRIAERSGLTEVSIEREPRWQHLNKHLDHVLFRGMELKDVQVLTDVNSSDHYPITVHFLV